MAAPFVCENWSEEIDELDLNSNRSTPPISPNVPGKMSRKKWKALKKKLKRKEKRSEEARKTDELQKPSGDLNENESTDSEEERQREREEEERRRQNELWLEREKKAQEEFQAKKDWEEKERLKKEETERKIREEWEERERREKEEQERKEKQEAERRTKQDKLLKEATANENKDGGAWHNPIAPVQYSNERQVELCPFFKKTGACRFGEQCSRQHEYPELSTTIMIPGMFSSFELEQSVVDNYDTDISLEYEDNDLYNSFCDFYNDVVPEFKTVGTLVQFKVCCNCEPHLRGNVYVQYKRESSALEAFQKFNARWYGGKQLSCVFINITSWRAAICGLAFKKRCPKGKSCNFLHVFPNPGHEFAAADMDRTPGDLTDRHTVGGPSSHRDSLRRWRDSSRQSSVRRSRSRSWSPSRRSESRRSSHYKNRSRSRSRSRLSTRSSRKRSRSKSKSPPSHRHASRRRTRSRSYDRSSRSSVSHKQRSSHKYSSSDKRRQSSSRSRSRERKTKSVTSRSPSPTGGRYHREALSSSKTTHLSKKRNLSRSPSPSGSFHRDTSSSKTTHFFSKSRKNGQSKNSRNSKSDKSVKDSSPSYQSSSSSGSSSEEEEQVYVFVEKTKDTITAAHR